VDKQIKLGTTVFLILLGLLGVALASQRDVVINEIAWMGTKANPYDEWIVANTH